jgi:hypothetical protein
MLSDSGHQNVRHRGKARYRRRMIRKTAEPTIHVEDRVWGNPLYLKTNVSNSNLGAETTENLGFCP